MARIAPKKASPKKAAARKAPARKAAKPTKVVKAKTPAAKAAAKPGRHMPAARKAQIRRQVARPRPGGHPEMDEAQHAHQDPRIEVPGIGEAGDKVQAFNYGQFKNKAVARNDKPVNWFRRAAKPKS